MIKLLHVLTYWSSSLLKTLILLIKNLVIINEKKPLFEQSLYYIPWLDGCFPFMLPVISQLLPSSGYSPFKLIHYQFDLLIFWNIHIRKKSPLISTNLNIHRCAFSRQNGDYQILIRNLALATDVVIYYAQVVILHGPNPLISHMYLNLKCIWGDKSLSDPLDSSLWLWCWY